MTHMTGMGPEALLVKSRVDPRVELAEYARMECSRAEVRVVEERIRRELELLPVRRSVTQRLIRWGKQRLRHDELPLAAAPALWKHEVEPLAMRDGEARALAHASLAALPAFREGARPEAAVRSISAAPVFARD